MSDLCNAVKILAQEAINSQKPLEAVFGKVINESPLKIETEQRLILTKDFITVAEHLRERTINVHIDDRTVAMKIDNSLKKEDTVIMLRQQSPSYTYRLKSTEVKGYCDGLEALRQSIYCILSTDRYDYIIYSRNYGIEIKDLIGKPISYVCAVIKGRIEEALLIDDRIESVTDFVITKGKGSVLVAFTVVSSMGDVKIEKEFEF